MFLGVEESEGMNPHTPKVGSWSSGGLLNLQKVIAGVKSHWIEVFLISLKIYWNVDV